MTQPAQPSPDVVGLAAITARLRVGSRVTVWAYTRLERDPLRLRRFLRRVWQRGAHLDEWNERRLHGAQANLPKLVGMRALQAFVGRGVTEAQLLGWSRRARDPLPLLMVGGDVVAFESAVRDWCFAHDRSCAPDDNGRIERRSVGARKSAGNQADLSASI